MLRRLSFLLTVAFIFCVLSGGTYGQDNKLLVLCGAAFKMPMEEIVAGFERQTGTQVNVSYASVGSLFSQIVLSKRGDVFIVPSPDLMRKAIDRGLAADESLKNLGYFVPVINVQKGNPKGIQSLKDMTRSGVRVAIGNPETVYVGILAVEIADKALNDVERRRFRENVVTYGEDFSKLSSLLLLKRVDAIIGFSYLENWFPDKIDTIRLDPSEIMRIGAGQAALLSYVENRPLAQKFLDYLETRESREIFRKYHYFATQEEAIAWLGAPKPIAGDYTLSEYWTGK